MQASAGLQNFARSLRAQFDNPKLASLKIEYRARAVFRAKASDAIIAQRMAYGYINGNKMRNQDSILSDG